MATNSTSNDQEKVTFNPQWLNSLDLEGEATDGAKPLDRWFLASVQDGVKLHVKSYGQLVHLMEFITNVLPKKPKSEQKKAEVATVEGGDGGKIVEPTPTKQTPTVGNNSTADKLRASIERLTALNQAQEGKSPPSTMSAKSTTHPKVINLWEDESSSEHTDDDTPIAAANIDNVVKPLKSSDETSNATTPANAIGVTDDIEQPEKPTTPIITAKSTQEENKVDNAGVGSEENGGGDSSMDWDAVFDSIAKNPKFQKLFGQQ